MRHRRTRLATSVSALVIVAGLGLSACGSSSDSDTGSAASDETTSAAPEPDASVTPEEPDSSLAADSTGQPAWAFPVTTPGTKLTTVDVGDVTVDVYQVGTAPADDTGSFVDPDTNKPLIEVGDTLVFLNYVVTNNGDPIDLGSSQVSVSARYADWPYLQGMDGLTGDELWTAQGINEPGTLAPDGYNDAGVYPLGSGESYSFGENFEYQPDSPIEFDISYTPVDAQGELLHDDRVEGKGKATIA